MPSDETFEKEKMDLAFDIRDDLETAIEANNNRIAEIMKSDPNVVKETDESVFELSVTAKESLEVLKDMNIDYDEWIEGFAENDWTIRTLKLWFFLIGEQSAWSSWPVIFDDAKFMKNAS